MIRLPKSTPAFVLLAGALAGGAGCQKTLFPDNEPRTQFELQDQMRGRFTPLEKPNVFGEPQPALRERLSKRD